MRRNEDARHVILDSERYRVLMAYANDMAGELGQADEAQVAAIGRHAGKFNRHLRNDIPLVLRPAFILQHRQEYAAALRQWASRTGTKAYLLMTANCGTERYFFPVVVMGRSALSVGPSEPRRYVVVRPYGLTDDQAAALQRHRQITGRVITHGSSVKLALHPITGPLVLHASWMNDRDGVIDFAALPGHLKLSPPEGSHECHGGLLDGIWRAPSLLS